MSAFAAAAGILRYVSGNLFHCASAALHLQHVLISHQHVPHSMKIDVHTTLKTNIAPKNCGFQ